MQIIDGRKIAAEIIGRLQALPTPQKYLAAVLAGDNAASKSFLKQKEKLAQGLGVDFRLRVLSAAASKDELRAEVAKLADDAACGGIIVQLPLPDRAIEHDILDTIPEEKDVDVLGIPALTKFHAGESSILPPSAGVVKEILDVHRRPLASFSVAVVGTGQLVGQPIAAWLKGRAKVVMVFDKGDDLLLLKKMDVVVLGAGVPGLVSGAMLKDDALVIDFGYGVKEGKTMGDFDVTPDGADAPRISYTPTPGGTGPILVAKLLENFYELNGE